MRREERLRMRNISLNVYVSVPASETDVELVCHWHTICKARTIMNHARYCASLEGKWNKWKPGMNLKGTILFKEPIKDALSSE